MASTTDRIRNGAPLHISRNTEDRSTEVIPRTPEAIPSHLPLQYIFAKRGTTARRLVLEGSRERIYGSETFAIPGAYATHSTLFSNLWAETANAQMIERVIPTDAGPKANLLLSVEVIEKTVDTYVRDPQGNIVIDDLTDEPIVDVTAPGVEIRWVRSSIDDVAGLDTVFGLRNVVPTVHNAGDPEEYTSTIYPLIDLKESTIGADGNNTGIRLWTPRTGSTTAIDQRLITEQKVYPFRLSVIRRSETTTNAIVQSTLQAQQSVVVGAKADFLSPYTRESYDFTRAITRAFVDNTNATFPDEEPFIGETHIYRNNWETVAKLIAGKEIAYLATAATNLQAQRAALVSDLKETDDVDEVAYMVNLLNFANSAGGQYNTVSVVDGVNDAEFTKVTFGETNNLYFAGGSDGTMTNATFDALVSERVKEYSDINSKLHDTAMNVENVIYDSGFSVETKFDLLDFISVRNNTMVLLATHVHGSPKMTASEDTALGQALRTRALNFPESAYFGTPVTRAAIFTRSALIRNSNWTDRVSPLYEVGRMYANGMGAANGRWTIGASTGGAPGSILSNLYDFSETFTPAAARNADWELGLNWVQTFDRGSVFIPALRTVYPDDTSVLNSISTALAICNLQDILDRTWRYFSGVENLTRNQLKSRVETYIRNAVEGRFAGRFIIEPEVSFTDEDIALGYSWTVVLRIWAANMRTVMTSHIQANRLDNYTSTTTGG